MKKALFFTLIFLFAKLQVSAQQFRLYQASEAGITILNQSEIKDEKLPGTLITLSPYIHQLEISTVIPSIINYSERSNFNTTGSPVSFDLKMTVYPNKMQRVITSNIVFTANGTLRLNNISKSVLVQYTPLPEDTDDEGQMRLSLFATFKLSDFFPEVYPNESIAFVVKNGFVNRR